MRWGASLVNGRFVYATDAWWWWIPGQDILVLVWNWVCCQRWGHDDTLWHLEEAGHIPGAEADCVNCGTRLFGCTCNTQVSEGAE